MLYEEVVCYNFPEFADKFSSNSKEGKSNIADILNNDNKFQVCSDESDDGDDSTSWGD